MQKLKFGVNLLYQTICMEMGKIFILSSLLVFVVLQFESAAFRPRQNKPRFNVGRGRLSINTETSQEHETVTVKKIALRRKPRRKRSRLTKDQCQMNLYQNLTTCIYTKEKPSRLMNLSDRYLCANQDRWVDDNDTESNTHTITKRDLNICSGPLSKTVILEAYDADDPTVIRELLHDPMNHLYQTLYTENCETTSNVGEFECQMHSTIMKAAVWALDNSSDIDVKNVLVDSYCALTQIES
ncbi:uncharacterized protein LOC143447418 isoform X2 [Clavelina lepadiformis]|uniref:uncharacterized protein LOC143447418 isoform X2 n=1 Tax=Clavelina lepadiformis TaxID=159417 RepID=UPI004041F960